MHVTQPGITMGTPLYMSPEQAQGHALDHRSDLYSLGVTFYHMLTGVPPFRAESAVALALKHVNELPVSLRVHRPEIPVELERLVLKLMAKNPADRYQSAAEMLADLARIRGSLQAGRRRSRPSDVIGVISRSRGRRRPLGVERRARRRRPVVRRPPSAAVAGRDSRAGWPWRLAAGVFLLAGAALGWNARRRPARRRRGRSRPGSRAWLSSRAGTRSPSRYGAEEQYRYAQLRRPADDQAAAWLAVPGYFPESHEWVSPAYLQLARWLYRQKRPRPADGFPGSSPPGRRRRPPTRSSPRSSKSAVKLLNKDLDGVIEGMSTGSSTGDERDSTIYDPGLLEFSVEIVADAIRRPPAGAGRRGDQARRWPRFRSVCSGRC